MSVDEQSRPAERGAAYGSFDVTSLTPHLGAEVEGLDLARPLTAEQLSDVRQAFADWSVLVFRNQHLDRTAHKGFARHFGSLHVHPLNASQADPSVLAIETKKDSPYVRGNAWHTDVTCDAIPPLASALYITETPECGGGDTLFADMYLAYDLLSPAMQTFLEGLTAVHDGGIPYVGSYKSTPPEGGYPRNEHPVVAVHPVTGKKILYVNSGFTSHIQELEPWESRAVLDALFAHIATMPRLHCRVQWRPNTLTLWDNRCTQHHVVWDYYPYSRYGERVSVIGDAAPAGVT
ncbi:MAG: TauD/TfdA dioxygenase family protein [Ilumatobacter sp.]|uniref:TauD/TfdA dioxygenase family protein n=1 Tax=Ilumatobacter sp. TaxID=1967498 RepID=UPI00391CD319